MQVDENLQLSDESAMEYCDVDDIGSVDGCDSSDEDWNPDKDDDSDDEKADFFNWLDKNKTSKHTMTLPYIIDQHLNQIMQRYPDYMQLQLYWNIRWVHTSLVSRP